MIHILIYLQYRFLEATIYKNIYYNLMSDHRTPMKVNGRFPSISFFSVKGLLTFRFVVELFIKVVCFLCKTLFLYAGTYETLFDTLLNNERTALSLTNNENENSAYQYLFFIPFFTLPMYNLFNPI